MQFVIVERGCYETLVWRAWSFWKPTLKETSAAAADENVVGNKTLSYAVHFWS